MIIHQNKRLNHDKHISSIDEITLELMKAAVENVNYSILITTPYIDAPEPAIIYVNPTFIMMTEYFKE